MQLARANLTAPAERNDFNVKVALFTETYIPDVNGVAAHVKTLRDGLEALGHQVLVVAADKHCKHHYVQDGVLHCPSVESKKFYGFGVASPISRKRFKLIAEFNPDIFHIHHEFGIGLSGIRAAKLTGKPLVYTLHTMYDQYVYYIAPRPFLNIATKLTHRYEKFVASRANALTGPSQKCHEYFKAIGVEGKEFFLIPNSADLEAFDPSKVDEEARLALREKLGIPADRSITCFVGRLGKEKSVDVLMEYWAETVSPADKLHLMIIGDGPDRQELEELADSLGIRDMVTFTGRVEHKEIPAYYAICDVYATASLSEMNSISMLEGMASGLPTLQRFDELNADQIQSGVNGYLYNNAEEFSHYLKNIASKSPEEKTALKQEVRLSIADRGAKGLAKYMITVYEKAYLEKEQNTPKRRVRKYSLL